MRSHPTRFVTLLAVLVLTACTPPGPITLGSRTLDFSNFGQPETPMPQPVPPLGNMPIGAVQSSALPALTPATPAVSSGAQNFGHGPVRVALLLPLSGDPGMSSVGTSLANASRLAVSYIEANTNIADNITVTLKDTGTSPAGAAQAASAAVSEGAQIILGPLRADQVAAAGGVAKSAGIPLIGFSNNAAAAEPGVYLLSVLPEREVMRSLAYVQADGRKDFAAIFPATDFGRVQERAFRKAAAALGIVPAAIVNVSTPAEASAAMSKLLPLIGSGQIDALFLPDRGTAPSFAAMLDNGGVQHANLTVIGSADWEGDAAIAQSAALTGAVYPAVDPGGYTVIAPQYQARFGAMPHPLATLGYTATILANVSALSRANPPYPVGVLTSSAGFSGRDGAFRFHPDGTSDYALVIKQVAPGGAQLLDPARL